MARRFPFAVPALALVALSGCAPVLQDQAPAPISEARISDEAELVLDEEAAPAPIPEADDAVALSSDADAPAPEEPRLVIAEAERRAPAREELARNEPMMKVAKAKKDEARPMARPKPSPSPAQAPSPIATGERQHRFAVDGLVAEKGEMAAVGDATVAEPPIAPVTPADGVFDYGINGFVVTAEDRLSTFAVDVDTASYTMARRSLNDGYLPPEAGVRVEEFVNYFPYRYARPEAGEPFGIDVEAAPAPFDERRTVVRIGVQGKKVSYEERKPVHLTFLVDTSGSMRSADKIELVKRSLVMLTEELEDGDTVAIATYAGGTKVVLEPTPVSRSKDIVRSLERLTAGGSTAMASGMQLAYELADAAYRPGSVNRVIVCSDGDANVGATSPDEISRTIRGYADRGITLTTLGFGNGNYKDVMMERLANDGDGNYFYIDSDREARRVLVDKLTSTLEVIAKDVKLQVEWNPGAVTAYRLVGYENRDVADRDFRNDAVDAGEIGAGHQVTAVYEVLLADDPEGELATVRVRNKAPGPDSPAVERRYPVATRIVKPAYSETTRQFRIATSAAYFAEILRGSPHLEEISLRQVESLARSAQRAEHPEDAELVALIGRAADLRGERPIARR